MRDLFIPLRGYFRDFVTRKTRINFIDKILSEWLTNDDSRDSIRLLAGEPGIGKSSILKMFSEKVIFTSDFVIIFIPVRRFRLQNDFIKSIDGYLTSIGLDLSMKDHKKVLIIFDGIDELITPHEVQIERIKEFISLTVKEIENSNHFGNNAYKAILSCREIIIQSIGHNIVKPNQIIHLLPYLTSQSDVVYTEFELDDSAKLLSIDQRDKWWKKFGELNGENYGKLPADIKRREELLEITAQPLLNHMLGILYRTDSKFINDKLNTNELYRRMIETVYNRPYDDNNVAAAIKNLRIEDFENVLQIIAQSAWHKNCTYTSINEIIANNKSMYIKTILNKFVKIADENLISFLSTFYFKKVETAKIDDYVFEFSHKSFGEYLVSRKIVHTFVDILNDIDSSNILFFEKKLDTGLACFNDLIASNIIDVDYFSFISNEIQLFEDKTKIKMQDCIARIINYILEYGYPDTALTQKTIDGKLHQCIVSQINLFGLHSLISKQTGKTSKIVFKEKNELQRKIYKFYGVKINSLKTFNNMHFESVNIYELFFTEFDFSSCIFESSIQSKIKFDRSNIENLKYIDSELTYTGFNACSCSGFSFVSSILNNSRAISAKFDKSKFCNSQILSTDFFDIEFVDTIFKEVIIRDSVFDDVNFDSVNFDWDVSKGAGKNKCKSVLESNTFRSTSFVNFTMENSDISDTEFDNCVFDGVYFINIGFEQISFLNCKFKNCTFVMCVFKPVLFNRAEFTNTKFNLDKHTKDYSHVEITESNVINSTIPSDWFS